MYFYTNFKFYTLIYSLTHNAPPPIFTNELKGVKVRIGDTIILGCQGK